MKVVSALAAEWIEIVKILSSYMARRCLRPRGGVD